MNRFRIKSGVLLEYRGDAGNVEIPEGVTELGKSAFERTGLETLRLPSTVTKLGDRAFADCDALRELYAPGTLTDWGKGCIPHAVRVHVPAGSGADRLLREAGCTVVNDV